MVRRFVLLDTTRLLFAASPAFAQELVPQIMACGIVIAETGAGVRPAFSDHGAEP